MKKNTNPITLSFSQKHQKSLALTPNNQLPLVLTNEQLILPTNYPILKEEDQVVFLAGPIQGARDWHKEAIDYFQQNAPNIYVASPKKTYLDEAFVYEEQVNWERYYLNRAAKNGCILFFLSKEDVHIEGRAYAQTTRFELGEWTAKQAFTNCKVVVGIEEGFSGARYIKQRLMQDNPTIPIRHDLKTACEAVLEGLHQ